MPMIQARLRISKDEDLIRAVESLPEYIDKSDVFREALRHYFFGSDNKIKYHKNNSIAVDMPPMTLKQRELSDEALESKLDSLLDGL